MKTILLLTTLALATLAPAASFDTESFGASLNGWRRDHTARYSLGDGEYTTHKPTITTTHSPSFLNSCLIWWFLGGFSSIFFMLYSRKSLIYQQIDS